MIQKQKNFITNTVVINVYIYKNQINHVSVLFPDLKEKKLLVIKDARLVLVEVALRKINWFDKINKNTKRIIEQSNPDKIKIIDINLTKGKEVDKVLILKMDVVQNV
jgi:hypothetical protein